MLGVRVLVGLGMVLSLVVMLAVAAASWLVSFFWPECTFVFLCPVVPLALSGVSGSGFKVLGSLGRKTR